MAATGAGYREQKAVELAAVRHDLAHAEKRLSEIDGKAQEATERKARKDGGGRKKRAKGDMPRILAGAREDRQRGYRRKERANRRDGGAAEALDAVDTARRRIEILQPLSGQAALRLSLPAGRKCFGSTGSAPAISRSSRSCAICRSAIVEPGARRAGRAQQLRQDHAAED